MKVRFWGVRGSIPTPAASEEIEEKIVQAMLGADGVDLSDETASGRSILLITSTTGRFASNALRSTNRVCGIGPSEASTSNTAPSTIFRIRSTSPPKSAWPGVSRMLIL